MTRDIVFLAKYMPIFSRLRTVRIMGTAFGIRLKRIKRDRTGKKRP